MTAMRWNEHGAKVVLSYRDVSAWADRWPCFGPRRALMFEFDARGDLVDLDGDDERHDGYGVGCLSRDAQAWIALAALEHGPRGEVRT